MQLICMQKADARVKSYRFVIERRRPTLTRTEKIGHRPTICDKERKN